MNVLRVLGASLVGEAVNRTICLILIVVRPVVIVVGVGEKGVQGKMIDMLQEVVQGKIITKLLAEL